MQRSCSGTAAQARTVPLLASGLPTAAGYLFWHPTNGAARLHDTGLQGCDTIPGSSDFLPPLPEPAVARSISTRAAQAAASWTARGVADASSSSDVASRITAAPVCRRYPVGDLLSRSAPHRASGAPLPRASSALTFLFTATASSEERPARLIYALMRPAGPFFSTRSLS